MNNNSITIERKKLYKEIWEISLTGVAKKYKLNYSKLIHICKENNIPYPTSAYWTKKKMGLDTKDDIIPLPEFDKEKIELILKNNGPLFSSKISEEDKSIKEFEILDFLEENDRNKVAKVISELDIDKHKKMHKKISDYKNKIKEDKKEERQKNYYNPYYNIHDYLETGYFVNVSKFQKERCMKILSSIYYTIEKLGGKINEDFSINIGNELLTIEIEELKNQVNHELTKDEAQKLLEYEDAKKRYKYASKPNIRKYDYVYNGKLKIIFENKNYIKETDNVKLEDRLGDIIIKLYQMYEQHRVARVTREERKESRRGKKKKTRI